MKKIILLTALIGAATAQASNFNISIREAHDFHDAVRNRNAQLLANVQNRNGIFIPLNDARELMAVINDVIDSDNAYSWMRNFFAVYNNINRCNIGSFSNVWQQIVDQANRPLPIVRIMPQPAAAQRPVANPPAVHQTGPTISRCIRQGQRSLSRGYLLGAPTISRRIQRGAAQTPQPLNIDLNTAHHQTVGGAQPQILPALDREIDNFLESMNSSSMPPAGTPILPSISNFFQIIGERNLNPDAVIAAFKRINFEDINTTALIERFAVKLNGNDKNWAVIASRFFAVRKAFLEIESDDPYKLAFLGFIPFSDDDAADLGAVYGSRGGEVIAQLLNIYDDSMPVLFNVLHSINKNEAIGLARLFDGDMKVLLYFGSALEFDHTANRIVFPVLLETLLTDRYSFQTIMENNHVSKGVRAQNIFQQLMDADDFDHWNRDFTNKHCQDVFVKALGIVLHDNPDYYDLGNEADGIELPIILSDFDGDNGILWDNTFLDIITDLDTVKIHAKHMDENLKNLNNEKVRRAFPRYLAGAFVKLFDKVPQYTAIYRRPPEHSFDGGVASDNFNLNMVIYLFSGLENFITAWKSNRSNGAKYNIYEVVGQLIQGFWHCPSGQSSAIRTINRYIMAKTKNNQNFSVNDLLLASISMYCQDQVEKIFHFMVLNGEGEKRFILPGNRNIFAINAKDLRPVWEEVMRKQHVYLIAKGMYGLPTERSRCCEWSGNDSFHALHLYLLSRLENPHIVVALNAVYHSNNPQIRSYGIDLMEEEIGENFYNWGYQLVSQGDRLSTGNITDISSRHVDEIYLTLITGVMNHTPYLIEGIIEDGVFWNSIVSSFDRDTPELQNIQVLLDSCSDDEKNELSKRFLFYVLKSSQDSNGNELLSENI